MIYPLDHRRGRWGGESGGQRQIKLSIFTLRRRHLGKMRKFFFFFLAFFEMKTWEEDRTPAFLLAKGRPVAAFLFPPLQLGGRLHCFLKQDLQSTPTPGGPAAHHGLVGGTGQDSPLRQEVRDVGWGCRGGGEALAQSPPRRPTQLCSCNPAAQRE